MPGIAFLSGGQSDLDATAHLDAMNKIGGNPWPLTFSYGRALQAAPQKAWGGKAENVEAGKAAFAHRALMNSLAANGKWNKADESKAALSRFDPQPLRQASSEAGLVPRPSFLAKAS